MLRALVLQLVWLSKQALFFRCRSSHGMACLRPLLQVRERLSAEELLQRYGVSSSAGGGSGAGYVQMQELLQALEAAHAEKVRALVSDTRCAAEGEGSWLSRGQLCKAGSNRMCCCVGVRLTPAAMPAGLCITQVSRPVSALQRSTQHDTRTAVGHVYCRQRWRTSSAWSKKRWLA